jgi:transposase
MSEEETQHLLKEHADLKEAVAQKEQRIQELEALLTRAWQRIEELEKRLAKDSHNSSKPPSSDGFKRKERPRPKSEKPKGGQPGHQGHTLEPVATPDRVLTHRPSHCEACQCELPQGAGPVKERRQIHELPDLRLMVTEHQVETIGCPACQHLTTARFPAGVDAPAQYGPQMQALAVYLSQFQLLPMERIGELLGDLWGCHLSEGTLANWIAEAASTLEPSMLRLKGLLLQSRLDHVDETGGRIGGMLHWFHVTSSRWLTLYHWHRKRGKEAVNAIGILPHYEGRAMHDRWKSYDGYPCAHSVCGAHLLRDCLFVAEHDQQPWATAMYELLLRMQETTEQWRATGARALPQAERDALVLQYFDLLTQGEAAQREGSAKPSAPPADPRDFLPKKAGRPTKAERRARTALDKVLGPKAPKKMGRPRKDAALPDPRGQPTHQHAKNLLNALLTRADQVLAFLDDLSIPFTNNQAERDLRMIKVQQKISGTFRSEAGATAFCVIRSYLSTMRKQGRSMLAAMTAVFEGSPFPIAWEPAT